MGFVQQRDDEASDKWRELVNIRLQNMGGKGRKKRKEKEERA